MQPGDPLSDNSSYTLASAFLHAHHLAHVQWKGDSRGVMRVASVTPTRLRYFHDEYFTFRQSAYENTDLDFLKSDVTLFLNKQIVFDHKFDRKPLRVTGSALNDVFVQLRAICQVRAERMPAWINNTEGGLPEPQNVVAFANGILDLEADVSELIAPTPDWFSQSALPWHYDPTAKCPTILNYLHDALCTQDQVDLLQEWLGYIMSPDTSTQKMLMLLGRAGAGKGTLMRLMTDLVGKKSTATFKLIDLQKEFTLSAWLGKSLAICREAVLGKQSDVHQIMEELLAIVGEDDRFVNIKNKSPLPGERMGARIVMAMNGFPQLPANGNQLRRRALILSFDRLPRNVNPKLYEKMKLEMPGLTVWALDGLRRLRDREQFTVTSQTEELLDRLCRLSSPVRSFGDDCCTFPPEQVGPNGNPVPRPRELKRFLFEAWRVYASDNGHQPGQTNTFAERFYEAFPNARPVRIWHGKKRIPCVEGVVIDEAILDRVISDRKQLSFEEMEVRQGREDGQETERDPKPPEQRT